MKLGIFNNPPEFVKVRTYYIDDRRGWKYIKCKLISINPSRKSAKVVRSHRKMDVPLTKIVYENRDVE